MASSKKAPETTALVPHTTNVQLHRSRSFFWEARTRILLWYILLMTGLIGLSIPLFSQLILIEVKARVLEDLHQEAEMFDQLMEKRNIAGKPLQDDSLADLFQGFLDAQIPEDDTFLVTVLDGRFYGSSPRALPETIRENSALMQRWTTLTQPEQSEQKTSDPSIGSILYFAKPIAVEGKVRGVLVIAHLTAGEISEARQVISIVIKVLLAALSVALILTWVISGKVLEPLRSLITTARSISEADLNRRIPVQGSGELADLTVTFNEMMDRLQVAFTSQSAFINDAGHELRTPITIIQGHLELWGDDPREQRETLDLVMDELQRMNRLVDDLLLLAKSERPDFLQLGIVDLHLLTQELFAKATALAPRNWHLEALGQGLIEVDRQRVTQAVMNLAQNAVQHTQNPDLITLGSSVEKHCVRFWVCDTGSGIAPSDQARIFERFARAGNSRRFSEGSGLGLSIVKAIAEAHRGQVELVSKLGIGSTFTLVLPLKFSLDKQKLIFKR